MIYIAVGNRVWGRADTIEAAIAKAETVDSKAACKRVIVYECEDNTAELDGMGNICYEHGTTCKEVFRR